MIQQIQLSLLHLFMNLVQLPQACRVTSRGSHQTCSIKNGVLKNFAKITGKHQCLRPVNLSKMGHWKFLRALFSLNTFGRLRLHFEKAACFYSPSSQEFFILIWYTLEGWKAESTMLHVLNQGLVIRCRLLFRNNHTYTM